MTENNPIILKMEDIQNILLDRQRDIIGDTYVDENIIITVDLILLHKIIEKYKEKREISEYAISFLRHDISIQGADELNDMINFTTKHDNWERYGIKLVTRHYTRNIVGEKRKEPINWLQMHEDNKIKAK